MLKIAFICGSLEPGKDGVGDYTRILAAELMNRGHKCWLIALNDSHVKQSEAAGGALQQQGIPTLRLSQSDPWNIRVKNAVDWLGPHRLDWISIQFVPYSFHSKGLPFSLTKICVVAAEQTRWHIMFHELWIGMERSAPWRQRAVGALQRQIIRKLLVGISPSSISTQSSLYVAQLKNLGWNADYLPLFGNIPQLPEGEKHETFKEKPSFTFVIFGGIHSGAPILSFAQELTKYFAATGESAHLIICGRSGVEQEKWQRAWLEEGLSVEVLGEQTVEQMASIFASATCGIATTPMALIEKSGSAAAMLEHSLPVINVAPEWVARGVDNWTRPRGIYEYKANNLADLMRKIQNSEIRGVSAGSIADRLVSVFNH